MFRMVRKVIIAGIDEAGYGPILGPLVVSAAAFEVGDGRADGCLWAALKAAVTRTVSARDSRIAIVDSKKLHKPKDGLTRLERSVLSVVGAWRGLPPRLRGLLALVSPQTVAQLGAYPWYREADPALPLKADVGKLRIAAAMLQRTLAETGIRAAGLWSELLPEGHYNRLVGQTNNKAVVLTGLTLRLMQRISDAYPEHEIRFNVDKQGARDHYGPLLMRSFEDRRLRVVHEDHTRSEYELVGGSATWRVGFHESGESQHMPVALASCLSKYLREAFMECFNSYWRAHVPDLRPTAGYYADGLRFLKDIREHATALGLPDAMLVRSR